MRLGFGFASVAFVSRYCVIEVGQCPSKLLLLQMLLSLAPH